MPDKIAGLDRIVLYWALRMIVACENFCEDIDVPYLNGEAIKLVNDARTIIDIPETLALIIARLLELHFISIGLNIADNTEMYISYWPNKKYPIQSPKIEIKINQTLTENGLPTICLTMKQARIVAWNLIILPISATKETVIKQLYLLDFQEVTK